MLERLVYRSKATQPLGSLHLFNLLNEARQKNARLAITGHLLYLNDTFTQCIEGPPAAIESLWQSLLADPRHHDVQLISRQPVAERRFPQWSMAFSSYASLNNDNLPGYFPGGADGMTERAQLCRR